MNYHHKAIVYTSDESGEGKAVYWEDDNGKVTKKTKKISSDDDMSNVYKEFGFDDPQLDSEEFMNFSIPSPFGLLGNFAESFFGRSLNTPQDNSHREHLPEGIDIDKHHQRLADLREKQRLADAEKARLDAAKKYLQGQLESLKAIQAELKKGGDSEGVEAIQEDMKKIQEHIASM